MALGASPRMPDPVSRAVVEPSNQMADLAQKMLRVGWEVALKGLEMGKGGLIDVTG
jgi:hypothetical protein